MRTKRAIKWAAAAVAAVTVVTGGVLYLLIKRVPADYRPLNPTPAQNAAAVDSLRRTVVDFLGVTSGIGSRDPNLLPSQQLRHQEFVVRQEDLNRWMAALPDEALQFLREVGMSRPAVAIGEDRLTLYAHLQKMDAVIGLDLQFVFDEDERVTLRLLSARLGGLGLPDRLTAEYKRRLIGELRRQLSQVAAGGDDWFGPLRVGDAGEAGAKLIDAFDGRPMRLDIPKRYGHARVRDITLTRGKMILEIVSLLTDEGPRRAQSE